MSLGITLTNNILSKYIIKVISSFEKQKIFIENNY